MTKFIYILLLFTFHLAANSYAQGTISVVEENGVRDLLEARKFNNFKKDRFIRAWSVQIMTSRDKYQTMEKMQQVRSLFRDDTNLKIDWTYDQPYYRLHAGAFYTKIEAAAVLYKIIQHYPEAYIFKNNQVRSTDF